MKPKRRSSATASLLTFVLISGTMSSIASAESWPPPTGLSDFHDFTVPNRPLSDRAIERLRPKQLQNYERLVETFRGRFLAREAKQGGVALLVAPNLLPAKCVSLNGEPALRCFLAEFGALFMRTGDIVDPTTLVLDAERSGPVGDGQEWQVRLQQRLDGLEVKTSGIVAFFNGNRLTSVSGDLYALGGIDTRHPMTLKELLDIVPIDSNVVNSKYPLRRMVDAPRREVVTIARNATSAFEVGERSKTLVAKRHADLHFPAQVTRNIRVHDYDRAFEAASYQTKVATAVVLRDCPFNLCLSSLTCRYYPSYLDVTPNEGDYGGINRAVRTLRGQGCGPGQSCIETAYFTDQSCTGQPFDTHSPPSVDFDANNLHYYIAYMASLFVAPDSHFDYPHSNEEITAATRPYLGITPEDPLGFFGSYAFTDNTLTVRADPVVNRARSLDTIAHEYGHFIHDQYGLNGRGAVREGWADHMEFRYAVREKFSTASWASLAFDDWLPGAGTAYWTWPEWRDGMVEPAGGFYEYYTAAQLCSDEDDYDTMYRCGSLISRIYWELAWNVCRVPFGSCAEGSDVITGGPFATQPYRLANSAFAYALANMSPDGTIGEFFDHVITRYWQFKVYYEYFSWSDYAHVNEILARQCVGWFDHCGSDPDYHHLPGHELPWTFAWKTAFVLGADQQQIWAEIMSRSPGVSTASFATDDQLGYLEIHHENDTATQAVNFVEPGDYRIRFAVRRWTSGPLLSAEVAGVGPFVVAGSLPIGQWGWVDGPIVTVSTTTGDVSVEFESAAFDLQAVVLERY